MSFFNWPDLWEERSRRLSHGMISRRFCFTASRVSSRRSEETHSVSNSTRHGLVFLKREDGGRLPIRPLRSSGSNFKRKVDGGIPSTILRNGIASFRPLPRSSSSSLKQWGRSLLLLRQATSRVH